MMETKKRTAARKVYKILCECKCKVPLTELIENTNKVMGDKYVVNISLKKVRHSKNHLLGFFNCRINYDSGTVSFVYSLAELENTFDVTADRKLNEIMEKIQKLLNVTEERGATEAEAIAASLHAQKLMKKYNIEYADMNSEKDEEITSLEADTPTGYKWKYGFAKDVANAYCCNVYRTGNKVLFRGYKSDILIARRVYMYLFDVCIKLAKKERAKGNDFTSFCLGFVDGVKSKLDENCKALALVIPRAVQNEWEEFQKELSKGTQYSFKRLDEESYITGKREGKKAVDGQYLESRNSHGENEVKALTTH